MSEETQLTEFLDRAEPRFENAPTDIVFQKEKSYAIQLLDNNPYLLKVATESPKSLLSAMSNVASIGLSLNPAKKQAYLITRNVKVGPNQYKSRIFLDPSYMGLCDIGTGTGCVEWVQAEVVFANDKFELNGINQEPTHTRNPFSADRGDFVGAYCVAKLPSGEFLTTALSAEEINKIRDKSEAWKAAINKGQKDGGGPWKDFPNEMRKKTVVRNAYKMWPKNTHFDRLAEAVQISNDNEGLELITTSPEIQEFTADQKHYFDSLIENADAMGMFVFMTSLSHGVQTALHNSFEKGSITKYKNIVRELQNDGRSQIMDVKAVFSEVGDDLAIKELLADLSQDVTDWVLNQLDDEPRQFVQTCQRELAA